MTLLPDPAEFLSFRGRASRGGLLVMAGVLLVADLGAGFVVFGSGASLTGPGMLAFKAASLWVATAAVAKRLHDLDLSAVWLLKGAAALVLWALAVATGLVLSFGAERSVNLAEFPFWLDVGLVSLPVFAAIVWLHVTPGSEGPNRFGPPPGASGFSRNGRTAPGPSEAPDGAGQAV